MLVIRVVILLLFMLGFSYVIFNQGWIVTPFVLGAFMLLSVLELIHYLFRLQRKLAYAFHQYQFENQLVLKTHFPTVFEALAKIIHVKRSESSALRQNEALLDSVFKNLPQALVITNERDEILFQTDYVNQRFAWNLGSHLKDVNLQGADLYSAFQLVGENNTQLFEAHDYNFSFPFDFILEKKEITVKEERYFLYHFQFDKAQSHEFEAWSNFAKVVAHEIRNGISPIKSLANSLQDEVEEFENESLQDDFSSALSVIENRCDSLLEFTDKYRKLVRITPPVKDYFSLQDLLLKIEKLNAAKLKGVELTKRGNLEEVVLFGDEKQMMHVFENLLLNSLQAFERNKIQNPKIIIELNDLKSDVLILFTDNGGGIKVDQLSHIFLPFYTTQEEGSGIGLSVSRQILAKHKANIHVVKEQPPLTTFSIRFPKGRI